MSFHNNICQLVQKAIAAYLASENLSFAPNIYTSVLDDTAVNPSVLVKCADADCDNDEEGNWTTIADVEYRENKDDTTEAQHHERAGEVFASFATRTKADDISNALSNFTTQQIIRKRQGWKADGRLWVSFLRLELKGCCGSDIP